MDNEVDDVSFLHTFSNCVNESNPEEYKRSKRIVGPVPVFNITAANDNCQLNKKAIPQVVANTEPSSTIQQSGQSCAQHLKSSCCPFHAQPENGLNGECYTPTDVLFCSGSKGNAYKDRKLQCPFYANMLHRIQSFDREEIRWPHNFLCIEKVAEAGLFYIGKIVHNNVVYYDYVECYICGGTLFAFKSGDDPVKEHNKHYPRCGSARASKKVR